MIYTLTYSPSIDYLVYLDDLKEGALNLTKRDAYYLGGKGVNVSQVLKGLGIDNTALGFIAGFTGDEIENGLQRIGCKTDFIRLSNGHSRINVKIKGQKETEINALGPSVDANSLDKLYEKISGIMGDDILVLAGRMSMGMSAMTFATLMDKLPDKNTKVVVDTTGEMLNNVLPFRPFLIKPNHIELSELLMEDFSGQDTDKIVDAAKYLQSKGARNVLVSLAEDGAVLVTENGQVFSRSAPLGYVKNSVGSGDSMVAGFLAGFLEKGDYEDAFVLGICAGSATAFSEGLAKGDEIMQMYRLLR